MHEKRFYIFSFQVTLTFDLLTLNLFAKLYISRVVHPPHVKFLPLPSFEKIEKIVGTGQTYGWTGQTDCVQRSMRPCRVGRIITFCAVCMKTLELSLFLRSQQNIMSAKYVIEILPINVDAGSVASLSTKRPTLTI